MFFPYELVHYDYLGGPFCHELEHDVNHGLVVEDNVLSTKKVR